MASQEDVQAIVTQQVAVGNSGGFYVGVTGGVGVNSQVIKYFSGGSLAIYGDTVSAAGASTLNGYLMGTSEALNIGGPAAYYLVATGATAVVMILRTKTAGN